MGSALVMVVAQPAELVVFDPNARVERACELIVDAGLAGAGWIIFPEAYLPGAPAWIWFVPHDDAITGGLHALALAAAVVIPGAVSDRLCRIAQRSRVGVTIGVVEHDHGTYYNSLLFIDAHGRIRSHYRAPMDRGNRQRWTPISRTVSGDNTSLAEDLTRVGGI
jgi:predicted amidohydrolase